MDPVTTFQVAGSAIALIGTGVQLVQHAWTIYRDGKQPDQVAKLEGHALAFRQALEKEVQLRGEPNSGVIPPGLTQLRSDGLEFSKKLLARFRDAGFSDEKGYSKRSAMKVAYNTFIRADVLKKEEEELARIQNGLSLQLLCVLREFAVESHTIQQNTLNKLKVSARSQDEIKTSMQLILEHLNPNKAGLSDAGGLKSVQANLLQCIAEEDYSKQSDYLSRIVVKDKVKRHISHRILDHLAYEGINQRQEVVAKTYETTFSWILEAPGESRKWDSFTAWCNGSEQIYWISGKPGSGKSTLMKFLTESQSGKEISADDTSLRIHSHLKSWAGSKQLLIIPFYFWAAGSRSIQRSREGLMRTFLWHILRSIRQLIPQVMPARFEALAFTGVDTGSANWKEHALEAHLTTAITALAQLETNICFFIDGLDEFDGEPTHLLTFVEKLAANGTHVKICVASRPWSEFQDKFKNTPRLRLEELTHDDITLFVEKQLHEHPEFAGLNLRASIFAATIVKNIVDKACGVFLWVAIVVASLLAGLNNGDRAQDLQKKLDMLPSELQDLYDRLLSGLDKAYHEHRSQMIRLIETAHGPLNLEVFAFADELDLKSFKQLEVKPLSKSERDGHLAAARRRLDSRWRGLLEVNQAYTRSSAVTVYYLHKTVKEWIESDAMQELLRTAIKTSYDPYFQLCLAYCASWKLMGKDCNEESTLFRRALEYAALARKTSEPAIKQVLCYLHDSIEDQAIYTQSMEKLFKTAIRCRTVPLLSLAIGQRFPQPWLNSALLMVTLQFEPDIPESLITAMAESTLLLLKNGATVEPSWSYICWELGFPYTYGDAADKHSRLSKWLAAFVLYGADLNILRANLRNLDRYECQVAGTEMLKQDLKRIKPIRKPLSSGVLTRFRTPKQVHARDLRSQAYFRTKALEPFRQQQQQQKQMQQRRRRRHKRPSPPVDSPSADATR